MRQWPRRRSASCGACLDGGQVGDGVHDLGAPAPLLQVADPASDLQRLRGVREREAGHGDDLEAAGLHAAVAAVAGAVQDRDLAPGQGAQLGVEGGLVALDREHVVGVFVDDQELGGVALGVQRVGGDDDAGKVEVGQQRLKPVTSLGAPSTWRWASTAPVA
jgi:hypothetical protein